MHVQFLLDSLASGGAQRQAVEVARKLHGTRDVRVSFVVYHGLDFFGPRLAEAGIPVHRLHKRFRLDPTLPLALRRVIHREAPDVLHAFLPPSCLYAYLALRLLPVRHRPVLVSAERSALRDSNSPGLWLERLVYPRSDAVTVNAEPVMREICQRLGVPADRVHYIPNGIDLEEWDRLAGAESPLALEPGCFHLALVGGLRAEKNHGVLLDALSRLPEAERKDVRAWFIGGETGAPGVAESIRADIARRGLAPIVRIVPATRQIAAVMQRLDALVLPSAFEGFPNVLLEAMASRLPAIASRVGDVPNMLEEGRTGFLVDPGDAAGLAGALHRLRSCSREERHEMGARARRIVEERYRLEVVAARHLALYDGLVAGRTAARA